MTQLLERIGIELPIFQAPMAGVATPALAAAVSNAGALGALGLGSSTADAARAMILELRAATDRPFHVNVFANEPAGRDAQRESAWLAALAPTFRRYGADPPRALEAPYRSFREDDAMLAALVDAAPRVISFHFGIPDAERLDALRATGALLLASATSLAEGCAAEAAGMDGVIAQGYEAGGHRGAFDPAAPDEQLGTLALTRLLVRRLQIPVIAAGGIMDGDGIAAVLRLGAVAAQLGTAFVACPESSASAAYRAALLAGDDAHTVMTSSISGRPARCLVNRFTALASELTVPAPDYPIAYHAGKALHAAASARGEHGYGAQWAGQGAPLARAMPAPELVAVLARELNDAGNLMGISPCFIVADLQRSIAYYRDRMGFDVEHEGPDDDPFFAIVHRDDVRIMLKAISSDVRPQPNHTRHEWARLDGYVYTRDPDALFDEFAARDVSFVTPLSFIDDGLWGFEVADADGYVIAFARLRSE